MGGWRGNHSTEHMDPCALTFDGSSAKTFVNGFPKRTVSGLSGAVAISAGPLKIGSRSDSRIAMFPNLVFNGLIDEVEIFNRALETDEILSIFNAGSTGKCRPGQFPCVLDLTLSLTDSTLNWEFVLGTLAPATWNLWISIGNVTFRLQSIPLPVIDPASPVNGLILEFPQLGTIGFLTTLTTRGEGIICSDWQTIDTGTPAVMPTAQELKGLFEKSGP